MKNIYITLAVGIILIGGFYAFNAYIYNEEQAHRAFYYKDALYLIDEQWVALGESMSSVPLSESKITTKYFGNELKTDLNNDGVEDIAFIVTQETGGSGVFYYAVGAVMTEEGYMGTEGFLLGDRIAPQTTNINSNPRHKNVVVFNYADRAVGEPMIARPSIGKSVYLKLVS